MAKIHQALSDDGILILNIISSLEGEKSKFLQAEYLTIKQYFPQIYLFPVRYFDEASAGKIQNIVLVAVKDEDRLSKDQLRQLATPDQKRFVDHLWEDNFNIEPNTKILTDDFAPVDNYIAKFL